MTSKPLLFCSDKSLLLLPENNQTILMIWPEVSWRLSVSRYQFSKSFCCSLMQQLIVLYSWHPAVIILFFFFIYNSSSFSFILLFFFLRLSRQLSLIIWHRLVVMWPFFFFVEHKSLFDVMRIWSNFPHLFLRLILFSVIRKA